MIYKWIYAALLGSFSLDILVRRWIGGQIPTQISPTLVYALLLLNGFTVFHCLFATKTDKN